MQSEENLEKRLEAIQKSVIPVVRLLAGRLGWLVDDQTIARIGLSPFPQSPLEESVVQLCVEVCRAYSGCATVCRGVPGLLRLTAGAYQAESGMSCYKIGSLEAFSARTRIIAMLRILCSDLWR